MTHPYIRKEVLDLPAYRIPVEEDVVKLNQNESPWDIPAEMKMKVIERFLSASWNRYGEAEPSMLKKQLAHFLGVWPDHIVIANGSNVLVQAILLAVSIGKKVLCLKPTFSIYGLQSRLLSNQVIEVPLNADFSLDVERILWDLEEERPSAVFIPNPNAPTGNLFKKADLLEIVARAACPVVIDEAYYPFSELTLVDEIKRFPNLIVMRTLSKAFAMAGVRLGYLVADWEMATQIAKTLLPFCVPVLTQVAAEVILEDPRFVQGYVDALIKERDKLYEAMKKIRGIAAFPSRANFILFRVPNTRNVFNRLLQQKVLVRDVSDDDRLANCLRVSVGTPEENQIFLKALKQVIR
jgi:histidinol-phosphate aminotransferase